MPQGEASLSWERWNQVQERNQMNLTQRLKKNMIKERKREVPLSLSTYSGLGFHFFLISLGLCLLLLFPSLLPAKATHFSSQKLLWQIESVPGKEWVGCFTSSLCINMQTCPAAVRRAACFVFQVFYLGRHFLLGWMWLWNLGAM